MIGVRFFERRLECLGSSPAAPGENQLAQGFLSIVSILNINPVRINILHWKCWEALLLKAVLSVCPSVCLSHAVQDIERNFASYDRAVLLVS